MYRRGPSLCKSAGPEVPAGRTDPRRMRHRVPTQYINYINGPSSHDQDFFEFRMSRTELFAPHNGGLVAMHPGETEYATFRTHGMDAFESAIPLERQTVILDSCRHCHSDSGIHSVQSRLQWMKRSQDVRQQENEENTVTRLPGRPMRPSRASSTSRSSTYYRGYGTVLIRVWPWPVKNVRPKRRQQSELVTLMCAGGQKSATVTKMSPKMAQNG